MAAEKPGSILELIMPLRQRQHPSPSPEARELLRRLLEEWRNPQEDRSEPVIIEEGGTGNLPTHLYVVWGDWGNLDQRERSEIIMDAYEQVRGTDASLRVSVAMGLTSVEASRMGIEYK